MTYIKTPEGNIFTTNNPEYWKDCTILTKAEGAKLYRAQHIADLKKRIKPGDTVYTVLRHRSASGMRRHISLFIIGKRKGEKPHILDIDYSAAIVMGDKVAKDGGIIADGCGQDMGFALVYNLGRALWPKGTPKPHGSRNGAPDSDGGYALKHSWL